MRSAIVFFFLVGLLGMAWHTQAAIWTITYPRSELEGDRRIDYPIALLDLALKKTGVRYELKPSFNPITQLKSIKRLEENLEINVLWTMTDESREKSLRPIRIPITKGLIGWRVLVTHKDNPFLFGKVNSLDSLRKFAAVQGISWPDTKILQANGFNVVTARDYLEATEKLNDHLADFFPRSIIEVLGELENDYSKNFRMRKGYVIQYPAAQYFFTNKSNVTLSNLIKTGLERAIKDGSFDALFREHFGDVLETLDIPSATYFSLSNPLLPQLTPIGNEQLWYSPPK